MGRHTFTAAVVLLLGAAHLPPANAQNPTFNDTLLTQVRAAAHDVPGELPQSLHYLKFAGFTTPLSAAVAGAGDQVVNGAYTVFQIRYSRNWIMVDAGVDREVETDTTVTIYADRYERAQEALRGASLIVVTHEHHDHIAGVIHTPDRDSLAPKTVLTRAQVQTLLRRIPRGVPLGSSPLIQLTSRAAARYIVIDYERFYPIAPGVVLIKAAGHTPGSQMVYVKLSSGKELLLIGDIAWFMAGVERRLQKPLAVSREMREDRTALQAQLNWLSGLTRREHIELVNCHDEAWLRRLSGRGVLKEDLDLAAD